ncbi:MAG: hypothetical protein QOH96_1001 [Blastocatellia bacterium]|nr:hypothetical protein [Blastocatellia bacterium]
MGSLAAQAQRWATYFSESTMKQYPTCNRTYPDVNQSFCLDDDAANGYKRTRSDSRLLSQAEGFVLRRYAFSAHERIVIFRAATEDALVMPPPRCKRHCHASRAQPVVGSLLPLFHRLFGHSCRGEARGKELLEIVTPICTAPPSYRLVDN